MDMTSASNDQPEKPKRLYFKSYLQLIRNSVGSEIFRNFYVETTEQGEFDALADGTYSCAFYVSSVLTLFKKLQGIHATVQSTITDLKESGWQEATQSKAGDVLVWEAIQFDDGPNEHIGFSIGAGRAISTSLSQRAPIEHDETFDGARKIEQIFRMTEWDS